MIWIIAAYAIALPVRIALAYVTSLVIGAVMYGDTADGPWFFDLLKRGVDIKDMRETLIFGQTITEGLRGVDPRAAVAALAISVSNLGKAQAVVGRGQNQFNYAVNLAQSQLTNLAASESRIRDADLAEEAASLTKAQILLPLWLLQEP